MKNKLPFLPIQNFDGKGPLPISPKFSHIVDTMLLSTTRLALVAGSLIWLLVAACTPPPTHESADYDRQALAKKMEYALTAELLDKWFPAVVDKDSGGYFSNFSADWERLPQQEKMIVTQGRHMWTAAKAAAFFPETTYFRPACEQGLPFLRDAMWDSVYGGFFTLVDRSGNAIDPTDPPGDKVAYGNAFGIYGLAAHHALTGSPESLELAQRAFRWLDEHAHDPIHGGYFQHLSRDGSVYGRDLQAVAGATRTQALGLKDQNSSIHLLEAFTELYQVWPDSVLGERLGEMLHLIRDVITQPPGYLQLFLYPDWKPYSFRDSTEAVRKENYALDHVSFGHDVETAFLMIEASEALGKKDYDLTLEVGKRMVDHALDYGFDYRHGGFFERGYYYAGEDTLRIIDERKNWWSQAEGLNALLLFSQLFPEEQRYEAAFLQQWDYIDKNLIDHDRGGWYAFGIDESPQAKEGRKGHIWKSAYHNGRSLMHCIHLLRNEHKGTGKE